jgi:SLOG in TRPM, prokaryote
MVRAAILAAMAGVVRHVASKTELLDAIDSLAREDGMRPGGGVGGAPPRAVILIGGADFTETRLLARLRAFFAVLAAHLERTGARVVDGGTDSGVMRLVAEARTAIDGTFLLIGVAPAGAVRRRTRTGAPIDVASGHSLIILVPGTRFGAETEWLFEAADRLGGGRAATIVVNGGKLTFEEARLRLAGGHQVVVVQGSGRAADRLGSDAGLRASGRLRVIPLGVSEAQLAAALE